ncbi:PP2C family protein-serine/threonine phosphatase [Halalkalibacter nanhaiisediminis]|uniref:PPM-type phosphatase domain-containing protein n=1 Tax=Halalkalibacter nanhaiisediminis TaxID=688079 RepID=A0A562QGU3_9BACI|nr:PP2C family protein-serine/threonine phosphatase [Halalkalibacter nanhaiisediminis]TWI55977.1 sigma-B regulation protein RsbU (phosphoserine phosphatase)/hypothetical protein [Halalkalibacter nanhaiisediminis]
MNDRDRSALVHNVSFNESKIDLYEKQLTREINLAKNIQTRLLNGSSPSLIEGEITGTSIPARLVGGDYYDFYPLVDGRLRIVIGDVMGKGIPAAMLMILTRGAFRAAAESQSGPSETLTAMNNALYEDLRGLGSFVTIFCADWDPKTGILTFSSAGHNLPLVVRNHEIIDIPKVSGVMLGGLPDQKYDVQKMQLEDFDTVFFYTDGIIEAENKNKEQFKLVRLKEVLTENICLNVDQIKQKVIQALKKYIEEVPQKDDITMIILKTKKEAPDLEQGSSPRSD